MRLCAGAKNQAKDPGLGPIFEAAPVNMGKTMQIYGLKACDTCRKARKALPKAEFVDVRETGVPPELLDAALAQFGSDLVNTRSTTWRSLDETARAEDPIALLQRHPALMKRPLIRAGNTLFLGWSAEVEAAAKQVSGEA
jgi:arsenate reductase